jgi:hypothetical protein
MNIEARDKAKRSWLSLPIIAIITRLLSRELALQNEYLRTENRILKSKVNGRIIFTTEEKRTLIDAALVLGRDMMNTDLTRA